MPALARAEPYANVWRLLQKLTPEQVVAYLDAHPEAIDVVEDALAVYAGQGWRADPARMAHRLTEGRYQLYPYVRYLAKRFVDAAEGRSTRLIINLPPRLGKTLFLQWALVWMLDRRPESRSIFVSYGDKLAQKTARGVRDVLRQHGGVLRAQLMRDVQRADLFETDAGGALLAAGIDSSITGFGAGDGGVVILDDPMKSWTEAHSAAQRDHVWNQFLGTIRNRLDQESVPILVVHARWHEDDISGRLLSRFEDAIGEEFEHVALPHMAEENDPLGRAVGEPLAPERFTAQELVSRFQGQSSYIVSALEQQHPSPEEGNELLRAWFRLEETLPLRPDEALTSWDLKLKDREAGDFVVGQCWWRAGGYWLMDQLRGGWDHGTTACAIALLAVRRPEARRHVVEWAGSADEVVPQLRLPQPGYVVSDAVANALGMNFAERAAVEVVRRRGMTGLVPHPVKGSKEVRARAWIAPFAEAGDVHLSAAAPWAPHLLDELAAFPNGAHDDQVDAMSLALSKLAHQPSSSSSPAGRSLPTPTAGRPSLARPGGGAARYGTQRPFPRRP